MFSSKLDENRSRTESGFKNFFREKGGTEAVIEKTR